MAKFSEFLEACQKVIACLEKIFAYEEGWRDRGKFKEIAGINLDELPGKFAAIHQFHKLKLEAVNTYLEKQERETDGFELLESITGHFGKDFVRN